MPFLSILIDSLLFCYLLEHIDNLSKPERQDMFNHAAIMKDAHRIARDLVMLDSACAPRRIAFTSQSA